MNKHNCDINIEKTYTIIAREIISKQNYTHLINF